VQPIVCPSTNVQELTTADCLLTDNSYYDVYSFAGTAGQQVTITMTSSAFDTYLFLIDPSGSNDVAQDDNSGGGTNSQIVFTLTQTGTWFIVANAFDPNVFGAYTLTLACSGPPPTITPTASPTGSPTITPTRPPTAVPQLQDPTCVRPGVLGCPSTAADAQLTAADCLLKDGSYYDVFRFSGTEGQTVTIAMSSATFDTFLFLRDPGGNAVAQDDDGGGGTNSLLVFTLTSTGSWTIFANSFEPRTFGAYTIALNCSGGLGNTATPLSGVAPADIPTITFPAMLLLGIALAAGALVLMRRSSV
jgi:hypothetical protein